MGLLRDMDLVINSSNEMDETCWQCLTCTICNLYLHVIAFAYSLTLLPLSLSFPFFFPTCFSSLL